MVGDAALSFGSVLVRVSSDVAQPPSAAATSAIEITIVRLIVTCPPGQCTPYLDERDIGRGRPCRYHGATECKDYRPRGSVARCWHVVCRSCGERRLTMLQLGWKAGTAPDQRGFLTAYGRDVLPRIRRHAGVRERAA